MSFEKFINEANEAVKLSLEKLGIKNELFNLTEPSREEFGDLSCNVAFFFQLTVGLFRTTHLL